MEVINIVVSVVFLGVMIWILNGFIKDLNDGKGEESIAPNLVSTLGVLGTFSGICLGLWFFDTTNIDASIPKLLAGMKTAFITSIFGMFLSICMKSKLAQKKLKEEPEIEDGFELFQEMLKTFRETNNLLKENQENSSAQFKNMEERLNDNQGELIKEIKLLNTDINRKQDELISGFEKFADTMAEQNSKSLVEALNDVIKDFNNKISEQFGENFKELNKAVGALLVWQENYKNHIEKTTQQLEVTIDAVGKIENSMEHISEQSESLINTSKSLNGVLKLVDENQKDINNSMEILSETSNNAKELIPSMNNYFEESIENMKISVETSNEILGNQTDLYVSKFEKMVEQLRKCIPEINSHINITTERFNETLSEFKNEIGKSVEFNIESIKSQLESMENTTRNVSENLERTTNELDSRLSTVTENTSKHIKDMVEEAEDIFKQKVDHLDDLLEKELTNSLNSLGSQLITISGKFADDYIPLANKLKEVINIAQGVNA